MKLKPHAKHKGRPKKSSKLWPSKRKELNGNKESKDANKENCSLTKGTKNESGKFVCKQCIVLHLQLTILSAVGKKRTRRCGTCAGCTVEDCKSCHYCKDMKKYGGSGTLKKACIKRNCLEGSELGNYN